MKGWNVEGRMLNQSYQVKRVKWKWPHSWPPLGLFILLYISMWTSLTTTTKKAEFNLSQAAPCTCTVLTHITPTPRSLSHDGLSCVDWAHSRTFHSSFLETKMKTGGDYMLKSKVLELRRHEWHFELLMSPSQCWMHSWIFSQFSVKKKRLNPKK